MAALFLISSVLGHASVTPPVASSAYAGVSIRVPHGCNTTATLEVTVQIPAGVTAVKPKRVPGWRLRTESRPLNTPITTEAGTTVTTEIDKVIWFEGNLPDDEFEDFPLSVKLPLPVAEGTRFFFPTSQRCVQGFANWTEVPTGSERPRWPAPALTFFSNGTMAKFNATWVNAQMRLVGAQSNSAQTNGMTVAAIAMMVASLL